jgi:eukaryotic-like serine/threonine-protein kinase
MTFLTDAALERLREAADAPDLAGTRYRLIGKLGQGGMGGVFRVEDPILEREVALKVVHIADGARGLSERLLQEARVIAKLEHPGIVPVHDVGTLPDGRPYYTMKLVQGERLEEHVASVPGLSDRLRIFLRICDAVGFAHAHGVIHRDLKPANIMIGPFGEVLVMDWGLSKLLGTSRALTIADQPNSDPASISQEQTGTAHGSILGTVGFMAPEQTRGDLVLDERADIYSLGAILNFILDGSGSPSVPRALAAIREKAMQDDRGQRYSGVPELAADVAHFLDGLAVAAYPESFLGRSWRWIVRNRTWILLLLVYMVTRALLILFRPR